MCMGESTKGFSLLSTVQGQTKNAFLCLVTDSFTVTPQEHSTTSIQNRCKPGKNPHTNTHSFSSLHHVQFLIWVPVSSIVIALRLQFSQYNVPHRTKKINYINKSLHDRKPLSYMHCIIQVDMNTVSVCSFFYSNYKEKICLGKYQKCSFLSQLAGGACALTPAGQWETKWANFYSYMSWTWTCDV